MWLQIHHRCVKSMSYTLPIYVLCTANKCKRKLRVLSKMFAEISSRFFRVSFDTEKLNRKNRGEFVSLLFVPDKEKFSFMFVQFQFIHQHPWLGRGQSWLQTIQYRSGVLCCKRFREYAVHWSGAEGERQRTSNWPLRDSKFEISFGGQSPKLILWHLPRQIQFYLDSVLKLMLNTVVIYCRYGRSLINLRTFPLTFSFLITPLLTHWLKHSDLFK